MTNKLSDSISKKMMSNREATLVLDFVCERAPLKDIFLCPKQQWRSLGGIMHGSSSRAVHTGFMTFAWFNLF